MLGRRNLTGILVPRADEHLNEYIPASADRLRWLTGFTGSAGLAIVLAGKAAVFTDGRYQTQIRAEVDQALFEIRHSIDEPAETWLAEDPGGYRRRGADRLLEGHVDRDEVPHRLDHRQRASGERAVLAAHDVVRHDDLDLPERVRPVTEPGAGDRVGDEGQPAGGDAPEQAHDVRVEVDAVDDRLDDHLGTDECGADDAGVAMRQRSHGVEHVRDRADAPVERRVRLRGGRVRVPERDDDLARVEQVDQLQGARQLGG